MKRCSREQTQGRGKAPAWALRVRSPRAFTLVELMIVLMIAGIVGALSWEGLKGLRQRVQLSGASRTLVSDLRGIQLQAVAARKKLWVALDAERGEFSVWVEDDPGAERMIRQARLPPPLRFGFAEGVEGPPSNPRPIPDSDGITFRDNRVVFLPSGALGTGAGTIYLTDGHARARTSAITVTVTGRVRGYQWTGEGWR